MFTVRLDRADDFTGWRDAARRHLAAATRPENLIWQVADSSASPDGADLFAAAPGSSSTPPQALAANVPPVPRAFLALAECVVCHREPERFARLYRVLWRRAHGAEPHLIEQQADPDVHRLHVLGKSVARERHKMHAFVRFRRTPDVEPEHFHAWFEPEHHSLRLSVPFFVRRFANMRWSIVTPAESAHWDGHEVGFGPGGRRGSGPESDAMEALWLTYFANIFNPARLKLDAMQSEMPVKYWKNLPEAPLIQNLVHEAGARSASMVATQAQSVPRFAAVAQYPRAVDESGAPLVPVGVTGMAALQAKANACLACPHAARATRAVNGHGSLGARLLIVGEQAGDVEDLTGRPFSGPAGQLLRKQLESLGIDENSVFFTNAVRHFDYEVRGKRRLHKSPSADTVNRCRPLLLEEIRLVQPRVVLLLGATAGRALRGRAVRVESERGQVHTTASGIDIVQSLHPAAVLRAESNVRDRLLGHLREDIELAWRRARTREHDRPEPDHSRSA